MSKRTEIATLGEFGLIRHLTEKIELKNESTVKGVGDDDGCKITTFFANKEVYRPIILFCLQFSVILQQKSSCKSKESRSTRTLLSS